ncbi:MAG: hypothetical protein ABSF70_11710 [Terracidiphilus sp.]|jgi:4-carboxymuconolactone decarboxylase
MAISEQVRRNHDELFPGHTSTLSVTDPRTRLMVQLASMIACQALREYPRSLNALCAIDEVVSYKAA